MISLRLRLFCALSISTLLWCADGKNVYQDPCLTNPCHQGTCVRIGSESHYLCICSNDNWGQHCEFVKGETYCESNQCANGATCIPDMKFDTKYRCLCRTDYGGQFCNQTKTQTPKQRCDAACGQWGKGTVDKRKVCKCDCQNGMYTGKFCNESLPCANFPCKNGGECTTSGGSYKCKCDKIFYKNPNCSKEYACRFKTTACETVKCDGGKSCKNGGKCVLISSDFNAPKAGPKAVCVCKPGFKGDLCQTNMTACSLKPEEDACNEALQNNDTKRIEACGNIRRKIEKCYNGGTCSERPIITTNGTNLSRASCKCPANWMGNACENENPCGNASACIQNSTCHITPTEHGLATRHMCICKSGYSGSDCHALDPNVCSPNTTKFVQCHFGGICVSCVENSGTISPFCRTEEDFKRHYVCACPIRRKGPKCDQSTLPCDIRRCRNGGICIDMNETDYECECLEGYDGRHCEIVNDYCAARLPCLNGGSCFVTSDEKKFECHCEPEFYGSSCQREYYNFASFYVDFYTHLAIWSFIAGSITSVLFAVGYWIFLNCAIRTKEKQF